MKYTHMTAREVCQYLRLARRKSDILAQSGVGWRPEYREELRKIDEQLKPLRAKVDQEHRRRQRKKEKLMAHRYDNYDEQGYRDMTLADAYEHHKNRIMDFVIGNGEVVEIWAAGKSLWSKKEPQAAGTAQGQ